MCWASIIFHSYLFLLLLDTPSLWSYSRGSTLVLWAEYCGTLGGVLL